MKSAIIKRTSVVLLGVLVAGTALAVHDGVSLKRKAKVGDEAEYKVSAKFSSDTGDILFAESESEKVTDVKTDGSWTVETNANHITVNVAGQEVSSPDNKATTEFLPNGKVKNITVDPPAEADTYRIANLSAFEAPDGVKNVGDDITFTEPADKAHGTPEYKGDFKVLALEKVKDWDTVKLGFDVEETEGDQKSSSKGTIWISAADGSLVKAENNWKDVQPHGVPFPLTGTYTIERTK
jgi:hypothetical protein